MKLKSASCSTGHGTGTAQAASLRVQLLRVRVRGLVKKYARRYDKITPRSTRDPDERRRFVLALLRGDEAVAKRAGYSRRDAAAA